MNFKIKKNMLLKSLNIINRGLSNKTPQPILKGIKIDVLEDKVILTASNSDIVIQSTIVDDLKVEKTGQAVLPGKYFIDIVKKVTDESVKFTQIDGNMIHINSGKSNFTLNGMEYEDYPETSFDLEKKPVSIPTIILKNVIKQTIFSASNQENRPVLTGVHFKIEDHKLTCVSTDSYRLAKKVVDIDTDSKFNVVIPAKSLEELEKIMGDVSSTVDIYISYNSISFVYENTVFKTRLLEGNYPETSRLIPEEFPIVVKFNKEELITVIEHAALLSTNEALSNIVKFNLRPDFVVEITSNNNEIGKVLEEINPIEKVKGSPIKIAFSSKFMIESLKVLKSSEVFINFTGEIRPFTIVGANDDNVTLLILPVRID